MVGRHASTVCPQHSWTVRVPAKVFLAHHLPPHPMELELLGQVPSRSRVEWQALVVPGNLGSGCQWVSASLAKEIGKYGETWNMDLLDNGQPKEPSVGRSLETKITFKKGSCFKGSSVKNNTIKPSNYFQKDTPL